MLIKLFKTSFLLQYVLLLILGGMLWSGSIFGSLTFDIASDPYLTPAYALLGNFIRMNTLISTISAFFLMLLGAFILNYTLSKFSLVQKNTLIPAMIYTVIMSHSSSLLYFHPTIVPSLLFVIILYFLFQVYTATEAYSQVFNSGFLIAVSSLFYFPSIYFLLLIWLSFIVFRLYYWREWLIVLFGFLTPYLFLWTYFFWMDELHVVFAAYSGYFSTLDFFKYDIHFSILNYFNSAVLIILVLWSAFLVAGDLNEKIISVRKRFWSLFWLFIIAILTYIIAGNLFKIHQVFILIPSAAFIAYGFLRSRRTFWLDVFFTLLVVLILIDNLATLFL